MALTRADLNKISDMIKVTVMAVVSEAIKTIIQNNSINLKQKPINYREKTIKRLEAYNILKHNMEKCEKDIEDLFKEELYGTGTTGKLIMENTNLKVTRFLSGPYGGDQQIGNLVALGQMDMVIFFRDPLTAQPHEPDINALMRLCDVHYVPLASNKATAIMLLKSVK